MVYLVGIVSTIIILISGYALKQSFISIQNIKTYETKAEKAAEWSETAKKRLWDTRYTIGTGFVSSLISLVTALAYLISVPSGDSLLSAPWRAIWPAVLAVALKFGSSRYMYDFWATKAKMPLLDQYNTAISHNMDVIGFLDVLSVGWGMMAVLKLFAL